MTIFWICSAQAAVITQTQDFRLFSNLFAGIGSDADNTNQNLQNFNGFDQSLGTLLNVIYKYDANVKTSWVYTGTGICTPGLFGGEVCVPAIGSTLVTRLSASLFNLGNKIDIPFNPIVSTHPGTSNIDLLASYVGGPVGGDFCDPVLSCIPTLFFTTKPLLGLPVPNGGGYTEIIGSLSLEFLYTPAVSSGGESPVGETPVSVPEPSTLGLLVLGLMGLATRRRSASINSWIIPSRTFFIGRYTSSIVIWRLKLCKGVWKGVKSIY